MSKKIRKPIDKKESKRIKITIDDIFSKGWKKLEPIDMTKHYEEDKKKVEKDKIRYQKDLKAEEKRFENISCPSCKNTNKKRNVISHMNGPVIYGERNSSTVYADYLICQGCGTMYVDLNKKEITPAYKGCMSPIGLHNY